MASPQCENGYTKIANELLAAMCKTRIRGEEMQCFHLILLKTYGWNKKEDPISLSQFERETGMNRKNITRALFGLEEKSMIKIRRNGTKSPNIYSINKNYDQWFGFPESARGNSATSKLGAILPLEENHSNVNEIDLTSGNSATTSLEAILPPAARGNFDDQLGAILPHTKEVFTKAVVKEKEIKKEKEILSLSSPETEEEFLDTKYGKLKGRKLEMFKELWEVFNYKKDRYNAAGVFYRIKNLDEKLFSEIIEGAKREATIYRPKKLSQGISAIYLQGWLSKRRWEDQLTEEEKNSVEGKHNDPLKKDEWQPVEKFYEIHDPNHEVYGSNIKKKVWTPKEVAEIKRKTLLGAQ